MYLVGTYFLLCFNILYNRKLRIIRQEIQGPNPNNAWIQTIKRREAKKGKEERGRIRKRSSIRTHNNNNKNLEGGRKKAYDDLRSNEVHTSPEGAEPKEGVWITRVVIPVDL